MDSIISGTFRMVIRGGCPHQLFLDDDFLKLMGIGDNSDPEGNFRAWEECVHPDDIPLIKEAIESTIHGLRAEVKYRWQHKTRGLYTAYSSGMLAGKENGCITIYGFFKGVPADRTQLYRYDPDLQLLTRLLAEKMLDSFAFCALVDIDNDRLMLLNDYFNTSTNAGRECSYDEWLENFQLFLHPDDRPRLKELLVRNNISSLFSGTDEVHGEFRFRRPEGYCWVILRLVKMKQKLVGRYPWFIVFRRIDADHRAVFMEELRNRLINGLAIPYLILDLVDLRADNFYSTTDKHGLFAEHFDEIGGYAEALARFSDSCGCSESDKNAILFNFNAENMTQRFAAGEHLIECEVCQNSGEHPEWIRIQAFMSATDENGDPAMAILTVQKITAEKLKELRYQQRLERALRTESQYRQAILSNAIAVYTYNITRDTIYDEVIEQEGVEPLLPQIGLQPPCSYDEYIVKKSEFFADRQTAENFRRTFCTSTLADMYNSHRRSFDTEYEFKIGDRTGYFREAVILTQDMDTGDIWGLTYVRDITHEHERATQVEQALRDAFDQAQHANSAKTLFMSQMSHDIRTPLNSILGMSAIAQEHIDDAMRVNDCLEKIQTSGRHLLEIINNVLDLSAIESGKTTLACEPFDLGVFIEDTASTIRTLADKKHQHFTVEIQDGINKSVLGDQTKLRQLLMNILSNAVKYTGTDGEIELSVKELNPDHHGIYRYLFTVRDNGIGMSHEFLQKIYDPFVRADDDRISGIQGTGLGMAIAINIARMMNGDISINSEVGKGSVFEVTICLKKGKSESDYIGGISMEEQPRRERMSDYDFGGKRVLLAEDLEFNAEIASEFLAEANIVTDVAHNGAEAVEMFSKSPAGYYSMIFMDIQMPVMDGYHAADNIRSLERPDAKTVPMLAMTANAFIEDVKAAKEHGMNGHISKPLEIRTLISELCKWLPEYTIKDKSGTK